MIPALCMAARLWPVRHQIIRYGIANIWMRPERWDGNVYMAACMFRFGETWEGKALRGDSVLMGLFKFRFLQCAIRI